MIQASVRPVGGQWQRPREISAVSSLAVAPQVVFDASGNAVAVWQRSEDERQIVESSTRARATGIWEAPSAVSSSTGNALSPQVAVDREGNALAVWVQSVRSVWTVQSAFRPVGAEWRQVKKIAQAGAGAVSPQVAFDPRGNAVVVWAQLGGTNWQISAAYRAPGASWQTPQDLAAAGEYPRVQIQVAFDARGNAVAVWEGLNGSHSVIQASTSNAVSRRTWAMPSDLSKEAGDSVAPQLAVDPRGEAIAIWANSSKKRWAVQAARRHAGKEWEPPEDLSRPGRDAVAPDVALDGRGNALAVWARSDGQSTIIQSAYRPVSAERWSKPRSVSEPGGDAVTPQVALDGQGNGVLVWSRFSGASFLAQASGYDGSGPALRDVVVPARGTVGRELTVSVAPLDTWSRVSATRWSFGDGVTVAGAHAAHVYSRPGRYTVRVTSTDGLGLSTTVSRTVLVS